MLGRLALGLLGGLGKGAMAAGGGKMALELAKMALGGKGRGAGRGGGTGGRGSQGGGRQQNMPLEELLGALSGEQKARAAGKIPSGRGLPSEPAACALCWEGEGTAVMADDNETALRCLAAHIVSFTEGRVRLRHPALRAAPVPDALRRELLEHPGLREATFNVVTGSALLLYDAGQLDRPGLLAALLPLGRYLVQVSALADETA